MRIISVLFYVAFACRSFSQDTVKSYYPNRKLRSWSIKLDTNLVFEKSFYENGKLEGEVTMFITLGKPLFKSAKTYYETGEIKDLRNDTFQIRYEPDGSVFQTSQIRSYRKNGVTKTYLKKRLWLEVEFKDDLENGWTTTYNNSGTVKIKQEYYINGKQQGPIKYFDTIGKLVKTIYYLEGCPYKAEYFDKMGKLTQTLTEKKAIYKKEAFWPIACPLPT